MSPCCQHGPQHPALNEKLPPGCIVKRPAITEEVARFFDEQEIIVPFRTVAFTEEKARSPGQDTALDLRFEQRQIVDRQDDARQVEIRLLAAFAAIELFHPAMQVWMLSPIVNFLILLIAPKIDLVVELPARFEDVHIQTHGASPLLEWMDAPRPFGCGYTHR